MKPMILIILSAFILHIQTYAITQTNIKQFHVDFDVSMEKGSSKYDKKFKKPHNKRDLDSLRELYNKNSLAKVMCSEQIKIPRIIHQIWIGDKDIPETYERFKETLLKHHPGWRYKLWTNDEVKTLKLHNQKLYDEAEEPAEKANLLRYEILNQFGGIYFDIDFECLKSFEPLIHCYDFFTGLEPVDSAHMLNNALIACAPHHPLIWQVIETIKDNVHQPSRFHRNGVGHFSRIFVANAHTLAGTIIAFPASYFYPLRIKYDAKKSIIKCLTPESFAVHYWANEHGTNVPTLAYKD